MIERMPTDDTPGQRMSWTTLADVEHLLRLDRLLRATALHGDEHRYLSTYCLVCDCHRGRRDEAT